MNIAAGPFVIAATLLALGGALKALRPIDTANALRGVGVPSGPGIVRLGGVGEAALGIWAITTGDRWSAILVGLSYLAFTGFVVVALVRAAPIASCGCFGKADTPPSLVHIGVNLVACLAAVAVAVDPGTGLRATLAAQPLAGLPFLLLAATGVFLAFLALTLLPRTLSVGRQSTATQAGPNELGAT
jgi:hypothetical protein